MLRITGPWLPVKMISLSFVVNFTKLMFAFNIDNIFSCEIKFSTAYIDNEVW